MKSKSTPRRYLWSCIFWSFALCMPSTLVTAGDLTTIADHIQALRQLEESARAGTIPTDQIATLKKLRSFVSQDPKITNNTQMSGKNSSFTPVAIVGKAQHEDAVAVDCREIQSRFYQAKAQWGQLLCVVDRILQLSAAPCPDLHCIRQLRSEAEVLKTNIDSLYPLQWDQKDLKFTRSWEFIPSRYQTEIETLVGKKSPLAEITTQKLQFTDFRRLKWRDTYWPDPANVPFTNILVGENRIDVVQDLSMTNYCLESIRMTLELDGVLAGSEDRKFGVQIQF